MCTRTDPGRVRSNNEDAVVCDASIGLCALADGLGGLDAGEVASGMVTAAILSGMSPGLRDRPRPSWQAVETALQACVSRVNRSLRVEAARRPGCRGMASTLVVGVFLDARLILGHIGDSRCYRWRRGVLSQLTRDHSYVQEQVDAGRMTSEQAAASGRRHLVTRALGAAPEARLELQAHDVESGDLYLLCSDGLTDMVSDAEIARLLAPSARLEQQAMALVDAANAGGGHDNISVALVRARGGCRTIPGSN